MWDVKKFQDFCPRDMESCYLAAAGACETMVTKCECELSVFEEPHQLTKFA